MEDLLDVEQLRGARFECRPDCGLCCYAEPRVEPAEARSLLTIAPAVRWVGGGSNRFLAARPNGGACQFLSAHRCGVHGARPAPCREFPVTVHVGTRFQATAVLSCPGVVLESVLGRDARSSSGIVGLEGELDSLRSRAARAGRRQEAAVRRRGRLMRALRAEGRWEDELSVRERFHRKIPLPDAQSFPVEDPPPSDGDLELLPLFFDHRDGPVALGEKLGSWELLELSREGGGRSLGVVAPPSAPPGVTAEGGRLLTAYLNYVLDRDAFLAAVLLHAAEWADGTVAEWTEVGLRTLGAEVLARGCVRAKLRGGDGSLLDAEAVADGIRAADMDSLDRSTWGDRL
jgi:Fe-S-cluster containining protein